MPYLSLNDRLNLKGCVCVEAFILVCTIFFVIYSICNRPNHSKDDDVLNLGGKMYDAQISIKDGIVSYRGAYGDKATAPVDQIQSVIISPNGFRTADIIIAGNGLELAKIKKIPSPWAKKASCWLTAKLELC